MAEQSIFDLTWARQDQWGGEWHSIGGRFRVAQQLMGDLLQQTATPAVEDSALAELVAWITDSLNAWANDTHPPQQPALATLIAELRDVTQRPIDSATYDALAGWMRQANCDAWLLTRLQHTRQLFTHLADTNYDHIQLRHLQSLFRAQGELALAFHSLFGNGDLGRLEPDPDIPLIHVNAALMAKCATDLRLAQQALQQRQRLSYPNQTQWISWEGHMLYLADQMAYVCL